MGEKKKSWWERCPGWGKVLLGLVVTAAVIGIMMYMKMAPIDKIRYYEVNVEPESDGTLDITYHITWEVLDDKKEGPLNWVKIGVANPRYELMGYGGSISFSRGNYPGYVSFYLDRKYHKGETADFWFTLRQKDMLCKNNSDGMLVFYDFTPGWFPNIEVEKYRFTWENSPHVVQNQADRTEGKLLVWEGSLERNGHRQMLVTYERQAFQNPEIVDWKKTDYDRENREYWNDRVAGLFKVGVIIFIIVIRFFLPGGYGRGRGFRSHHHGGSGCACACAGCACACACAGGGRAGCSRKDFTKDFMFVNRRRV